MGTRITSDEGVYALFDSVSGWAFGPTFASPDDAEAFLNYLHEQGEDGRELTDAQLGVRHTEWLALNEQSMGPVSS